jgi:hypothetical protein
MGRRIHKTGNGNRNKKKQEEKRNNINALDD